MLVNAFFLSHFSYCPLVWMCHTRIKNNKINRLHERRLQLISKGKQSSFHTVLEEIITFPRCPRQQKGTASTLTKENRTYFTIRAVKPVRYRLESLSYLGSKCWETLPLDLKQTKLLSEFKAKIKKWNPKNRSCDFARHTSKMLVLIESL